MLNHTNGVGIYRESKYRGLVNKFTNKTKQGITV